MSMSGFIFFKHLIMYFFRFLMNIQGVSYKRRHLYKFRQKSDYLLRTCVSKIPGAVIAFTFITGYISN